MEQSRTVPPLPSLSLPGRRNSVHRYDGIDGVLHLLSEFARLRVPIRVSEWQKDGGGMELSVRGMLVKMLVKKVESNKANDIGP